MKQWASDGNKVKAEKIQNLTNAVGKAEWKGQDAKYMLEKVPTKFATRGEMGRCTH